MRIFFHPDQSLHFPRSYYSRGKMRTPHEIPQRAECISNALSTAGFQVEAPQDFGVAPLEAVHDPAYLAFLKEAHARWMEVPEDWGDEVMSNIFIREPNAMHGILAQAARYLADGSCPIGPDTWMSAYWSAQCAVAGAHVILDGGRAAYALCRPPGHHARRDAAGGFCYLNNPAIAGQELRRQFSRVAILDVDMHHGQGIQEIFYDRSDVFYVSIHGDPTNFYPAVEGFEAERGIGDGKNFNLNLPMPHGSPEEFFFERLDRSIEAIDDYGADVLVLALGFDIYEQDPQSKIAVTTQGFIKLGKRIRALTLPCLITQEGGYHLDSLAVNALAFFGSPDVW